MADYKKKLKDIEDQQRSYSIVGNILSRRGGSSGFAVNSAQNDLTKQANSVIDQENKARQKAANAVARKTQQQQASALRTKLGAENIQNSPVGPNLDQYATKPEQSTLPGYGTAKPTVAQKPNTLEQIKSDFYGNPDYSTELEKPVDWTKVPYQTNERQPNSWLQNLPQRQQPTPVAPQPVPPPLETYIEDASAFRNAAVAGNQQFGKGPGIGSLRDAPTGNYATGGGLRADQPQANDLIQPIPNAKIGGPPPGQELMVSIMDKDGVPGTMFKRPDGSTYIVRHPEQVGRNSYMELSQQRNPASMNPGPLENNGTPAIPDGTRDQPTDIPQPLPRDGVVGAAASASQRIGDVLKNAAVTQQQQGTVNPQGRMALYGVDPGTAANALRVAGTPTGNFNDNAPLLVSALEKFGIADPNVIKGVLATVGVEASNFLPIEEIGKGGGRYIDKAPDGSTQNYFGRGYVQLTWKDNYLAYGRTLTQDPKSVLYGQDPNILANDPSLALKPEIAAEVMAVYFRDHAAGTRYNPLQAAKNGDWEYVRRGVNGGLNGYDLFKSILRGFGEAV